MHFPYGNFRLYFIVLTVNISSLMCGIMLTWPSPVLPKLISNKTLNENPLGRIISAQEESWIASLAPVGGILGCSLIGLVMEKFGRKFALAWVHIPNILSTLTAAFGNHIWYYYVSRIAAGMSSNSAIAMGALYFGEIAESHNRGVIYSTTSICINLGTFLSYCIGPYTSIRDFNLILFGIVLLGLIGTVIFVPESPYYYLQKQHIVKARESLKLLRGTDDVEPEIKLIQENIAKIQNAGLFGIFNSKAARKSFILGLILTSMQQLSGVNVIYSYTEIIFEEAGSTLTSDVASILVGVAQFVTIFITTFSIDRFGRKKMLTFSSFGLSFTLGLLATYFRFQEPNNTSSINWLPIVCLMLFFVFFNSGMGGVPFLYMSEILPLNVKSVSSSIIMAFYCLVCFLITYFYNDITNNIGINGGFYLFAGAMLCNAMFVLIFLFETRGKTLQEISERLGRTKRSKIAFSNKIGPVTENEWDLKTDSIKITY